MCIREGSIWGFQIEIFFFFRSLTMHSTRRCPRVIHDWASPPFQVARSSGQRMPIKGGGLDGDIPFFFFLHFFFFHLVIHKVFVEARREREREKESFSFPLFVPPTFGPRFLKEKGVLPPSVLYVLHTCSQVRIKRRMQPGGSAKTKSVG